MSSNTFYSAQDEASAERWRLMGNADADVRRQRSLALRRQHEQAIADLQQRLPFQWQGGIRKPRFTGPSLWEPVSLPAVHIMLLEPVELIKGIGPLIRRAAGDWLCSAALDTDTGELRYEGEKAPQWTDGSGGPGAHYDQMPTCKNCLRWAQKIKKN